MAEKLSKFEWEEKIRFAIDEKKVLSEPISDKSIKDIWWSSSSTNESIHGMRLSKIGIFWFEIAGIEFHKYECIVPVWTGALTLGLQRVLCPYYLEPIRYTHQEYTFYVTDDEYAMLLMFTNNDLTMFAKGLTK